MVFKVNKKTLVRWKSIVVVHFVRFEKTLPVVWVLLWPFWKRKLMSRVVLPIFSMLISSHIHNIANYAIAKNSWQTYFKKFEVFVFRKQQGAIRTDWKIYSCFFYHLCIMVTIFLVSNSLLIFQQQYFLWNNTQNRWKIILYKHVKSKKSCHQKRFPNCFWFHPPVLQGPFTRWLNNKLK